MARSLRTIALFYHKLEFPENNNNWCRAFVTFFFIQPVLIINASTIEFILNDNKFNTELPALSLLDGSASEKELEVLRQRANEDASWQADLASFHDLWQSAAISGASARYDAKEAWQKMIKKGSIKPPKSFGIGAYLPLLKIAAVLVMVLLAGYLTYFISNRNKSNAISSISSYHVPYGSKSYIRLPDGTMVWLNAGSTLSYDRQLGIENRDVRLEGEAFFAVKENIQHPFTVEAKGTLIQVVGTSFNVKAYLEEDYVETTVVEGIVKVLTAQNSNDESSAIILKPNQRLIIPSYSRSESATIHAEKLNDASESKQSAGKISVSSNVNTEFYTSWKEDKWMINSEKLGDLAIQIERRYDVVIFFSDLEIKQFVYSGILKDENLEEVLQIIASTSPIKFEIDNKSVYLSKRNIIQEEE